jgi:triosephosphate isomerase
MKKEQRKIYITYGGSVSGENIKEILKICDGVLVGKASTSENKLDNLLENLL